MLIGATFVIGTGMHCVNGMTNDISSAGGEIAVSESQRTWRSPLQRESAFARMH